MDQHFLQGYPPLVSWLKGLQKHVHQPMTSTEVVVTTGSQDGKYEHVYGILQWCQIENQQSPFYVVNRGTLNHDSIP